MKLWMSLIQIWKNPKFSMPLKQLKQVPWWSLAWFHLTALIHDTQHTYEVYLSILLSHIYCFHQFIYFFYICTPMYIYLDAYAMLNSIKCTSSNGPVRKANFASNWNKGQPLELWPCLLLWQVAIFDYGCTGCFKTSLIYMLRAMASYASVFLFSNLKDHIDINYQQQKSKVHIFIEWSLLK